MLAYWQLTVSKPPWSCWGEVVQWKMSHPTSPPPPSLYSLCMLAGQLYLFLNRYYYHNFPSLGKRPQEPRLPQRHANQPRVSCDEYEQGSCRWYDEWNYDHLVEYTSNIQNLIWFQEDVNNNSDDNLHTDWTACTKHLVTQFPLTTCEISSPLPLTHNTTLFVDLEGQTFLRVSGTVIFLKQKRKSVPNVFDQDCFQEMSF